MLLCKKNPLFIVDIKVLYKLIDHFIIWNKIWIYYLIISMMQSRCYSNFKLWRLMICIIQKVMFDCLQVNVLKIWMLYAVLNWMNLLYWRVWRVLAITLLQILLSLRLLLDSSAFSIILRVISGISYISGIQ